MAIIHRIIAGSTTDPSVLLKKRLSKAATFKMEGDWEVIKIKAAFPFRMKEQNGEYVLQAGSMGGGPGYKWHKRRTGTKADCYQYLIDFHNRRVRPDNGLRKV